MSSKWASDDGGDDEDDDDNDEDGDDVKECFKEAAEGGTQLKIGRWFLFPWLLYFCRSRFVFVISVPIYSVNV